jgi:hypothetical protein
VPGTLGHSGVGAPTEDPTTREGRLGLKARAKKKKTVRSPLPNAAPNGTLNNTPAPTTGETGPLTNRRLNNARQR